MDATDARAWPSTVDLAMPMRRLPGDGAAVRTWASRHLTGGTSDALGVCRVSGDAAAGDQVFSWSLILKGWRVPAAGVSSFWMS